MLALEIALGCQGALALASTHGNIFSDNRQSMNPAQLERYVRTYRNMRLRDRVMSRGRKAKKQQAEPKAYPLEMGGGLSSCDESEDELDMLWDAIVATWS